MRLADIQRPRFGKGRFGSFNVRKKLFVGKQMLNCLRSFAIDGKNTKQTQPTLKLENKIVAWGKLMWHVANGMLRNERFNRKGPQSA